MWPPRGNAGAFSVWAGWALHGGGWLTCRIRPRPTVTHAANPGSVCCHRAGMDSTTAMQVAVALVLTGLAGAAFARWRRALSDLRKTIAAIPGMRKTTRGEFGRTVVWAGGVALVLWVMARGGR